MARFEVVINKGETVITIDDVDTQIAAMDKARELLDGVLIITDIVAVCVRRAINIKHIARNSKITYV